MAFSVPAVAINYMLLTFRQVSKTDKYIATDFFYHNEYNENLRN
jgi:hypothetical protein